MMARMKKGKTIHDERYRKLITELAHERVRLGVSQGELAAQIGMNQSDVSKIEQCEKRLDLLEFKLILTALRIHENHRLQAVIKAFVGLPI